MSSVPVARKTSVSLEPAGSLPSTEMSTPASGGIVIGSSPSFPSMATSVVEPAVIGLFAVPTSIVAMGMPPIELVSPLAPS